MKKHLTKASAALSALLLLSSAVFFTGCPASPKDPTDNTPAETTKTDGTTSSGTTTETTTGNGSQTGTTGNNSNAIKLPRTHFVWKIYEENELTEQTEYTFNESSQVLTYNYKNYESDYEKSSQYSYEVLEDNKIKISIYKIKEDNKWLTIDELINERAALYSAVLDICNNPPATYAELQTQLNNIQPLSEEEFYQTIKLFGGKKDDDETTQKSVIASFAQAFPAFFNLSEGATIDNIKAQLKADLLSNYPKQVIFNYNIKENENEAEAKNYPEGAWLELEALFDNAKAWYEQYGNFNNTENSYSSVSTYNIYVNGCDYSGNWDDAYEKFNAKEKSYWDNNLQKTINETDSSVFTVTDNKDGTITLSGDNLTEPLTLSFEGTTYLR